MNNTPEIDRFETETEEVSLTVSPDRMDEDSAVLSGVEVAGSQVLSIKNSQVSGLDHSPERAVRYEEGPWARRLLYVSNKTDTVKSFFMTIVLVTKVEE